MMYKCALWLAGNAPWCRMVTVCLSVCLSVSEDIDPITETGKSDDIMAVAGGGGGDDAVGAGKFVNVCYVPFSATAQTT